jgi:hypothetical protein
MWLYGPDVASPLSTSLTAATCFGVAETRWTKHRAALLANRPAPLILTLLE